MTGPCMIFFLHFEQQACKLKQKIRKGAYSAPNFFERQHVRILVEASGKKDADDILEIADQVCEGLSAQDVDEIEDIAFSLKNFFGEGNSDET